MRVLFVTPYPPYPPDAGGKIRTLNLIREVARTHSVVLFTLEDATPKDEVTRQLSPFLEALEIYPVDRMPPLRRRLRPDLFRHFHSVALRRRLAEVLGSPGLDLVHVEELCLSDVLPRRTPAPRVLGRQKIDTLFYEQVSATDGRGRTLGGRLDLAKLRRAERRARRAFDGHVVCSALDARRLERLAGPLDHCIVPNGVDLDHFAPEPRRAGERPTLVFTGTMDYAPNIDAARHFVEDIWPAIHAERPDVEVLFVGHRPTEAVRALGERPGVHVTGSVPDVRPYLRDASAVIVPIRIGEGTRLKILEAMAMRVPVVSTPAGAEGLEVTDGVDIAIAADPRAFAHRTLRLLSDPAEAGRLAAAGHALVRARYGWPAVARTLLRYYQELAGRVARLRP